MKILLLSIGTQGDIEPFLAIAELLQAERHEVICVFPEQFRKIAADMNLPFYGLSPEFLKLLHSKDGQVVMGGGDSMLEKAFSFIRLAKKGMAINKIMMAEQHAIIDNLAPDLIIHHNKAVYPIYKQAKDQLPQKIVSPVPYILHPVPGYAHLGFKNSILGIDLTRISYKIANFSLLSFITSWSKKLKGVSKVSRKQLSRCLSRTPLIYTISPSLFVGEIPNMSLVKLVGYHEKSSESKWKPDSKLVDFINAHPKILFITFGSMTNPWPEKITRLFCRILEENNIPAIINTANGGLIKQDDVNNSLIHFVGRIPYHWILPKMYAIIHHGGSGTTHLGVKYGCASMIIPHIVDQFIWNQLLFKKGVGPKGIKINKLAYENLNGKVVDLWSNEKYKSQANSISQEMQKEDLKKEFLEALLE